MLSRRFFVGCSLVLALLFGSAGYLAAADEHATEGHGSEDHAVAEVEPGASDSGHDAAADEVRKILEDARRDAETQKQNILAEAEAAADAQKTRALKEIDAAKNGALQELAEKSVDTAVGLAGKIVQRQLTNEDHSSLISEAIKHFPGNN